MSDVKYLLCVRVTNRFFLFGDCKKRTFSSSSFTFLTFLSVKKISKSHPCVRRDAHTHTHASRRQQYPQRQRPREYSADKRYTRREHATELFCLLCGGSFPHIRKGGQRGRAFNNQYIKKCKQKIQQCRGSRRCRRKKTCCIYEPWSSRSDTPTSLLHRRFTARPVTLSSS